MNHPDRWYRLLWHAPIGPGTADWPWHLQIGLGPSTPDWEEILEPDKSDPLCKFKVDYETPLVQRQSAPYALTVFPCTWPH